MKFWLVVLTLVGLYVYKFSSSVSGVTEQSDNFFAEELLREESNEPGNNNTKNLKQALTLIVDSPPTRDQNVENASVRNIADRSILKQNFRDGFQEIPWDDTQKRLAHLYSFKATNDEENEFMRETLVEEFDRLAQRVTSSRQKDYLLDIQRIYLANVEEPEEAERTLIEWLKDFEHDRHFHEALVTNFLGRFPQLSSSWLQQKNEDDEVP